MRIYYTHVFKLFEHIIVGFASLISGVFCADISSHAGFGELVSFIALIFGGIVSGGILNIFSGNLSTKFYLSSFCDTEVSYKEAKKLSFLFDGTLGGKWYPLKDLRKIPQEFRRHILFEFAKKMEEHFSFVDYQKTDYAKRYKHQRLYDRQATKMVTEEYLLACSALGIQPGFHPDQLRQKYSEQIKKYHPDFYIDSLAELKNFATEKAKSINTAYEYLNTHSK